MRIDEVSTRTGREYWEEYWQKRPHDAHDDISIGKGKYSRGLYSMFYRFLDPGKSLSIVEIGGAPGLFISSLPQIHDRLKLGIIDYSDTGVAATKQVSAKFGFDIEIHQKDIYHSDWSALPKYDIAYSLGVVEHYEDLDLSVDRHLACVHDGGLVIIGLPVFLGVNEWLVNRLAPKNKSTWYPAIMDSRSWKHLHHRSDIEVLADEYVGGFNPHVHHRLEDQTSVPKKLLYVLLHRYFSRVWDLLPGTEKLNSKYFSFYYFFVARKRTTGAKR